MENGSVLSFSFKKSSVLGWKTVQFCLPVGMWNGSVLSCSMWERFSFVIFDVTTPSSLFSWETVQTVGMGNGSVLRFVM